MHFEKARSSAFTKVLPDCWVAVRAGEALKSRPETVIRVRISSIHVRKIIGGLPIDGRIRGVADSYIGHYDASVVNARSTVPMSALVPQVDGVSQPGVRLITQDLQLNESF